MNNEIWKDIPGYEHEYQASTLGRIKSLDRRIEVNHPIKGVIFANIKGRILKLKTATNGYKQVNLTGGKTKNVAPLIAATFIGDRPKNFDVCHNDGDICNNSVANLRYATHTENERDKKKHGTHNEGERHPLAKLTAEKVNAIRENKSKLTQKELAVIYGLSRQTISDIQIGKLWKSADSITKCHKKTGFQRYNAKLTEDDIRYIRSSKGVVKQKVLQEKYGVSQSVISNIQLHKRWKDVV